MSRFNTKFYDFMVHLPDEMDSIINIVSAAKEFGYSGIAALNLKKNLLDKNILDMSKLPEDFSISNAIEVSGKPSKLREEIRKYKDTGDILIARGKDEEIARAAVETERLDIILQPVKFNNVLGKIASDNSIALGFDIGSIIHTKSEDRVQELRIMRTNLMYARKYDLQMVLTCEPYSMYDFRSPREMAALGGLFGMSPKEAVDAMSTVPVDIMRKKSTGYIREGIEII
ncbi:MAG: RNase P subunit p30 family protein [Candidatus Methanoperedens sp.]|nr:RNase P subunit p30 family protein [Candidatus Methanoperedens sp.]